MALRQGEFAVKFTSDGAGRVVADLNSVGAASGQASGHLDKIGGAAAGAGGALDRLGGLAKTALLGGGLTAIVAFTTRSIVEFQKLEAQLTTFTGSFERTRQVMGDLRDLAGTIGSSTNELTQAFLNLTQRGIQPTNERLTAVANIAAQTGKTVEEVSRAYGAAAQGNARALTQLGANFIETTDGIVVKFKDGTQQLIREGENFIGVLDRIGNIEFAGAAIGQTNTLAGAFGNLSDAASDLAVTLAGPVATELALILRDLGQFVGYIDRFAQRIAEIKRIADRKSVV